uniref:RecA-like N-terminal domain-containing protein n=1 Tax=Ananas comosus var. bracteatus TaxID=296719 RepID=A0A6V7NP90_ANACO|nr:unnamed protein product [Ananas comosus var. bracteatus]
MAPLPQARNPSTLGRSALTPATPLSELEHSPSPSPLLIDPLLPLPPCPLQAPIPSLNRPRFHPRTSWPREEDPRSGDPRPGDPIQALGGVASRFGASIYWQLSNRRYGCYRAFEHALDPALAESIGVKTDNLLLSQPDSGEQALSLVDTRIRSGSVDVVVVDSVAALVPKSELDGEMGDARDGRCTRGPPS